MEVFRTKSTILECFVNHEQCVPKWYRNGVRIELGNPRYIITQEKLSGRCNLRINKNKNDDAGEYTCCINDNMDKNEENKTSCRLYILEPAFRFTKRLPAQIEGLEDQNIELECEIEDDDAECDWYINDDKIDPKDPKYEVIITGRTRKLIIKKCDPKSDRGHYVCRCGVSTTTASMGVKPALKFVHPLEANIEGLEESDFELSVEVTKPNIRSKWLRNGRVFNPNEEKYAGRFTVTTDGCFHKLSIKNLNMKDAAEFVVQVDELTSKTNFTVKECK